MLFCKPSFGKVHPLFRRLWEAECENAFLWSPVAWGAGVGFYFALPFEPPIGWTVALALAALAVAFVWRGLWAPKFLALLCGGVAAASLAALFYGTPLLEKPHGPARLSGVVRGVEQREGGQRLLLEDLLIQNLPRDKTPRSIHLTIGARALAKAQIEKIRPGDRIEAAAMLLPLSEPLLPGGFDFRLNGFFRGIGSTGYALGGVRVFPLEQAGGQAGIDRLRQNLQETIRRTLTGDEAGLAIILLTGDQTFLSAETAEAMRGVGLAHLLAIAGLHVGLAAGLVLYLSRFFMALFPPLALRFPIKKIAAFLALLAICFYTLQVGAPVPTRRALLMIGLALVAILVDRASLSLRTVCLAALFLLMAWPQFLLHPGFQLSFAAVMALIAVHQGAREKRFDPLGDRAGWFWAAPRSVLKLAGMSFVATVATLPACLFHFQEAEVYSVLANTLAIPLTAFFLMPLSLATDLLWPLGLAEWPLRLAQPGFHLLIQIAHYIAALPGAFYRPPPMPLSLFIVASFGGLAFCLMRTRLRWAGLLVLSAAVGLTFVSPRPVVFIAPDGSATGFVKDDHLWMVSEEKRPNLFLAEVWAAAAGLSKEAVSFEASAAACEGVSLCSAAAALDREILRERGAVAFYPHAGSYEMRYGREGRAARPWSPGWWNRFHEAGFLLKK